MSSDFVFINTSGPDDSKSAAKRKAVRSQAAKDHSSSSSKPEGSGRRRHRKLLSVAIDLDLYGSDTSAGSDSPPMAESSAAAAPELPSGLDKTEPASYGNNPGSVEEALTKLGLNTMPGAGWTSPFVPYPENKIAPTMLSHCKSSLVFHPVAYQQSNGLVKGSSCC